MRQKSVTVFIIVILVVGVLVFLCSSKGVGNQIVSWLENKSTDASKIARNKETTARELKAYSDCLKNHLTICEELRAAFSDDTLRALSESAPSASDVALPIDEADPTKLQPGKSVMIYNLPQMTRLQTKDFDVTFPKGWSVTSLGETDRWKYSLTVSPDKVTNDHSAMFTMTKDREAIDLKSLQANLESQGTSARFVHNSDADFLFIDKLEVQGAAPGMATFAARVKAPSGVYTIYGMGREDDAAEFTEMRSIEKSIKFK